MSVACCMMEGRGEKQPLMKKDKAGGRGVLQNSQAPYKNTVQGVLLDEMYEDVLSVDNSMTLSDR